ncbi:hypothetical protein PUNSTDRAFT_129033 [Punctularia strigosozonata HHB-11173 SS5]|uniref:uncharacterized protein n=1 Tax=Punctularia strigosozonata (strain HHB-11173) TaxID=741275 RepID=UPI0004418727|nr:uncharacterized protein PUNSTDRAFT_129033 [Punctularia strigosozonata HHB-11173 SS5]EIN13345.1 hypothetical protein PUNSTDRAFT_129033 [Punctularia strigosozonata HHB-11173 SS5]
MPHETLAVIATPSGLPRASASASPASSSASAVIGLDTRARIPLHQRILRKGDVLFWDVEKLVPRHRSGEQLLSKRDRHEPPTRNPFLGRWDRQTSSERHRLRTGNCQTTTTTVPSPVTTEANMARQFDDAGRKQPTRFGNMPPWALRDNAFDKPHYRLNRAALVELAEALGVEPGGNVHELKARTKQALFERRDELIEHPSYSALYTEREKNEFQQGRTQGTGTKAQTGKA